MMRNLFIAASLLGALPVLAQTVIKGKVSDALTKHVLAGASISFSSKGGTTTDSEGNFTIDCGKTNKITISFVGYVSQAYSIKNCNDEINISLQPASGTLNNVEITATSNPNKSLLYTPISITKLTPVELKRGTGIFIDEAINTNVPGV